MKDIENTLSTYFVNKAPKIPEDLQALMVQYGPYILIVFTILSFMSILSSFGIYSFGTSRFLRMMNPAYSFMYQVQIIFTIIMTVLTALAIPGLMNKKKSGWDWLFRATIVSVVFYIVTLNLIGLLIGAGLSLYVLLQIRHHYS